MFAPFEQSGRHHRTTAEKVTTIRELSHIQGPRAAQQDNGDDFGPQQPMDDVTAVSLEVHMMSGSARGFRAGAHLAETMRGCTR
jgi:hypothetical protein